MANKRQLAILKQGVAAWNKWREENPDAKIDLRGANLDGLDLSGANFSKADIRGTNFKDSILISADFNGSIIGEYNRLEKTIFICSNLTNATFDYCKIRSCSFNNSILNYSSWKNAKEIKRFFGDVNYFNNTIMSDSDVRELLISGKCKNIPLKWKNLQSTHLVDFNLCDADLRGTDLRQADLSRADITGAKLYNSARENWIIDGIRCDYVYWDEAGEQRTPPDRDFRPGEFEELYKQLPTFEYIFEQGFTPLDPLIMDRVVQAVNERHKEFLLELVNFDKRGQPHATFTVCHLEHVEKAKQQIAAGYEESKGSPERQEQLMDIISKLLDHNTLLAGNQSKSLDIIKQLGESAMGDTTYNISVSGGQIGAVGQSASASGNTFQQITADLSRLHEEMQRSAKTPEQRAAAEDVAKAAQAAREQNEPALLQHLKNAGKFAFDCAKTVGTDVTAEYFKKVMGI